MPIAILIGPPGSGKSTVGKALAKLLGTTFADTDALIEAKAGKKISDIFVEDGEPHFRSLETAVVAEALETEQGVLSLGGGAVMSVDTQSRLIHNPGKVILLDVSISQAAPRVGFNKDRPMLMINPRQQWQALLEKRLPVYEKLSNFRVSTDSMKPMEVAQNIADYLEAQ
jgi:shikimate kinase